MIDPESLRQYYRRLTDEALLEAYVAGPAAYEPAAWSVVSSEMQRRRLPVPEIPVPRFDPEVALEDPIPGNLTADQIDAVMVEAHRRSGTAFWWLAGGLFVTLSTWAAAADSGGTFAIAWGAILYGILRMWQSESRIRELTRARAQLTQAQRAHPSDRVPG